MNSERNIVINKSDYEKRLSTKDYTRTYFYILSKGAYISVLVGLASTHLC